MSDAEVFIAGRRLSTVGIVSGLTDSTIFRRVGWSGDYRASCTLVLPTLDSVPWIRRGALWEIYESGNLTWGGFVDEVSPEGGGAWSLSAYGRGMRASEFPALKPAAGGLFVPTGVPNEAVDNAEPLGLGFTRAGVNLGTSSVSQTPEEVVTVAEVLDRAVAPGVQRWWVDSYGRIAYRTPGPVVCVMRPGEEYMGTADDEYVSRLWGLFISGVDGAGEPNAWSLTYAPNDPSVEAQMVDKFGPRPQIVDLTALGATLSTSAARADLEGRYSSVGGRLGYTNGLELTTTNVRRVGTTVPAPLSVRAGDSLLLPGVDDDSSATYLPSITLTLGEVVRIHDEERAQVTPVGFAERGFSGALANAQAPRDAVQSA